MKRIGTRRAFLVVVLLGVLAVRMIPHAGESYARYVYPTLSGVLSAVSSIVPFSIDEWVVVAAMALLIAYPLRARKKGKTRRHIAAVMTEIVCWICVWFYAGWGMNYFRDTFYERTGITRCEANKRQFRAFLIRYTDSLNATYTPMRTIDREGIRREIKRLYTTVPKDCGLCQPLSWQHPKALAFNRLYSAVGVLGYMGPFMDESHLNALLLPAQYAMTYAHETAHLLSVSSEAEANYWAYYVCTHSRNRAIRCSGYYGIMPNVFHNARGMLSREEFVAWRRTIDRRIIADRLRQEAFWESQYSTLLGDIQNWMFNALLKGNRIPEGMRNYDQVLSIIISVENMEKRIRK